MEEREDKREKGREGSGEREKEREREGVMLVNHLSLGWR